MLEVRLEVRLDFSETIGGAMPKLGTIVAIPKVAEIGTTRGDIMGGTMAGGGAIGGGIDGGEARG